MQTVRHTHPIANREYAVDSAPSIIRQVLGFITEQLHKIQTRHRIKQMLDLKPHLLDDIGLTHHDVVDALTAGRGVDPVDVLETRRAERLADVRNDLLRRRNTL